MTLLLALLAALPAGAQQPAEQSKRIQSAAPVAEPRIVGLAPMVVVPRGKLKIFLGNDKLLNDGVSAHSPVLAVTVGGLEASVIDVAPGLVTVELPDKLPGPEKLDVVVLGNGYRISDPQYFVRTSLTETPLWSALLDLILSPAGIFAIASGLVLAGGTFGWLWLRARRLEKHNNELSFQIEHGDRNRDPQPRERGPRHTLAQPAPAVPQGLVDAILRNECALFWGAGLSAQAGYPTWADGLNDLVGRTIKDPVLQAELRERLQGGQASLVVDALRAALGRDGLIVQFSQMWKRRLKATAAMLEIGEIPFTNAVTAVWDDLIEEVFRKRQPRLVMGGGSDNLDDLLSRDAFCVVRLWGSLDEPASVALTTLDYRGTAGANPTFTRYLATLGVKQTHLFIGASLEALHEYLSAIPRSASTARVHYALVPDPGQTELQKEIFRTRYGVELIVYQPSAGWPQVPEFIGNLAKAVAVGLKARPKVPVEDFKLKSIRLRNIGPISDMSLSFDPKWTVLLGNNGSGKSTIIRAIALVLCGEDSRARAMAERLLRSGESTGEIELVVGDQSYLVKLSRDSEGNVRANTGSVVSPLESGRWAALGFPPLRGVITGGSTGSSGGSASGGQSRPVVDDVLPILLGLPDTRMSSIRQWLLDLHVRSVAGEGISAQEAQLNATIRDRFFELVSSFIPGSELRFAGVDRLNREVNVFSNGLKVGIEQVSQGTSSMLGWVGALLQRMYEIHGLEEDPQNKAVLVLIDEIDAHLHPEWQQQIVPKLKELFPRVQFVATTHSPFVVCELKKEQVFKVRTSEGRVVAEPPLHDIEGAGIAGLLSGELFAMERMVDSKTQHLLDNQRRLSALPGELSPQHEADLKAANEALERSGFRSVVRDAHYAEYLRLRAKGLDAVAAVSQTIPPEEGGGLSDEEMRAAVEEALRSVRAGVE
jgi:energy-coupling factor transporter ATP-binding protein EcfA2